MPDTIHAVPLSAARYAPYGEIVQASETGSAPANQGTARRSDFLADLRNLRPGAKPNLCVFRCAPFLGDRFEVKLLERHPYSTQIFLPLPGAGPALAVVALGGDAPDLATLAAFIVEGAQGLTYRPGVWHHPIVALGRPSDLACLVWEDGSSGDCEELSLPKPVAVAVR